MTVLLDGRKVGNLQMDRKVDAGKVVTSQVLHFHMTRSRVPLDLQSELLTTESTSGAPLSFLSNSKMSSQENLVNGEVRPDGLFQVSTTVGRQSKVSLLVWPEGALLGEGQRLAMVSKGFAAGTKYRLRNFDASRQQVADVDVEVLGDEVVSMPDGTRETLHHLHQSIVGNSGQSVDIWVDDKGAIRRNLSSLLGFRLEMVACNATCANAPDQDVDLLRAAMIASPRAMPSSFRYAPMRYTITILGDRASPFAMTDEQSVTPVGNGSYLLDVGFGMRRSSETGPLPEDTEPNDWVQSNNPAVIALAKSVAGNATSDLQRMRRLRSFLSDYIDQEGLDVGYASALETIETKRGDCTEHAVLLTAMARALGIPARVVTGVVYADRTAEASRVFVPHAWTQAWIKDRWVSFDSAQRRFDTTHIALGTGNGEPWRFFSAINSLSNIRIDRVTPIAELLALPPANPIPDYIPLHSPSTSPSPSPSPGHH